MRLCIFHSLKVSWRIICLLTVPCAQQYIKEKLKFSEKNLKPVSTLVFLLLFCNHLTEFIVF